MTLTQCSHIARKRGVYYFRRRLPHPHRGDVALSLSTRNFRTAEYLAELLASAFEELVAHSMSTLDLQPILSEYLRERLAFARSKLLKTPYGRAAFNSSADRYASPVDADVAAAEHMIEQFKEDLRKRDGRSIEPVMKRLADAKGVPEDQHHELSLGMLQASLQVQEQMLIWLRNGVTAPIDPSHPPPALIARPENSPKAAKSPEPKSPKDASPLLSELLPSFLTAMDRVWKGQTMAQNKATYRMFQEVCGDRPIGSYQRRDLSLFYQTLCALPALYAKKAAWRDLPLVEVAEIIKNSGDERLAMKTVKRHFGAMGRLFDHSKTHGEFEGDNPAYGFEFPTAKGRAKEDRDMWQGEKLTALFNSPVWRGCQSEARRSTPGSLIIKDEKYWLPLLGLYHGNRLEEFAQLHREDVKQEYDICYLDINDDGEKQLKNAQSKRRVPLHPKLKEMGFIQYVEATAPNVGDRVFPNLQPGGPDNKLGYYFTKWWSQYRRAVGVYDKKLNYHSFRHGVTTKLFSADVQEAFVDELTGHEGTTTSRKVYLKGLPLEALYEAICKVEWPEVALPVIVVNRCYS